MVGTGLLRGEPQQGRPPTDTIIKSFQDLRTNFLAIVPRSQTPHTEISLLARRAWPGARWHPAPWFVEFLTETSSY